MSGGHFDYDQYRIAIIADSIEDIVRKNRVEKRKEDLYNWDYDENGNINEYSKYYYNYSDDTIKEMRKAISILRIAEIYAQRIDWLVSGDDGEKEFHDRLKEELTKLLRNQKTENEIL